MATKTPVLPPVAPPRQSVPEGGGAVVLERRTQKAKPPQMYQVVMLNDDYTPMEFVVLVIQEFFGKDLEAATLTWNDNRAKSKKYAAIAQELAEFEAALQDAPNPPSVS